MGVVTSFDCLSGSQSLSFYVFRKSLSVEYHTSREYLTQTMTVGPPPLWTNGHRSANPSYHSANLLSHKKSSNEDVRHATELPKRPSASGSTRAMTIGLEGEEANGHGSR